jgi:hypothetical protein
MCFFNSSESAEEQKEPISTLKGPHYRKYSFQKLTQLSQGNNVLDAEAFNVMVFFGEIFLYLQLS